MTGQVPGAFRVGDAERDAAVSALGEHFAAGRLTKDEFDERSGRAWSARYAGDLDELFTDLPQPVAVSAESRPSGRPAGAARPPWPKLLVMLPLAIMAIGGLLFLIVVTAPWLLFIVGMLFLFGGPGRRRRRHGQWHGEWHGNGHDGGARPGWGPAPRGARPGWGPSSGAPWGRAAHEWRQAAGAGWGCGRY
ncbi:DUF1707 domain-containing protein [Jiangella ureilytica]|uniref:DUF1707 domain-containing protein n=1 Tax=Jiangella ureilytica TaxID=2530374 RepID=A0A4R4RNR6_9ACTN|nr:DUF1707 domain-containing protein [Jiangella ureilytica]TDC51458.1 DUF1707 domain-containing protein [Jiangella ureilytica]